MWYGVLIILVSVMVGGGVIGSDAFIIGLCIVLMLCAALAVLISSKGNMSESFYEEKRKEARERWISTLRNEGRHKEAQQFLDMWDKKKEEDK